MKLHDYLWFLQNFDKFDDFSLGKKMKHHYKYINYLKMLNKYLEEFIKRSKPLFHFDKYMENVETQFESKFSEGRLPGWEEEHDNLDESEWQYCAYCEKLYIRDRAYIDHLSGKNHAKHLKNKEDVDMDDEAIVKANEEKEEKAKIEFRENHLQKKK